MKKRGMGEQGVGEVGWSNGDDEDEATVRLSWEIERRGDMRGAVTMTKNRSCLLPFLFVVVVIFLGSSHR